MSIPLNHLFATLYCIINATDIVVMDILHRYRVLLTILGNKGYLGQDLGTVLLLGLRYNFLRHRLDLLSRAYLVLNRLRWFLFRLDHRGHGARWQLRPINRLGWHSRC